MSPKHWLYTVPLRLRSIFHRPQVERDLEDELKYHLDMKIEENIAKGMSSEEARRSALIALGGLDQKKEECRDARGIRWLEELHRDLRYAIHILWRQKALSLTVIGLLAFASAANTAIFSVYNGLFLRPFSFPDAERLVDFDESAPKWNQEYAGINYADFHDWRKENRTFEAIGLYQGIIRNYSRHGEAQVISGLAVTYDFAAVFQIQPVLGRGFLENEDRPHGTKVVMLSHGFWEREFGGSPSVLGETLKLDGEVYTVVGVLPSDAYPREVDLWIPLQKSPDDPANWYLRGTGRLKKGVTLEQAREDIARIHRNMIVTRPANKFTSPRLQFLREREFGKFRQGTTVLQFAVGILLLIVCVNIASMMLARSESRSQEMGIRTALGASRAAIIRQLLTESLSLAVPGVLLGLPLGHAFLKLITSPFEQQSWMNFTPDVRFLAFCGLLMGATTVLCGLAPALKAARVDVQRTLHETGSKSSAGGSRRRGLKLLVVGEVALAVVLLVGAGLLLRTWQKLLAVDPGFRAENLITFQINLPQAVYKRPDEWAHFFEQLIERYRQLPGVEAVSGTNTRPIRGFSPGFFEIEGAPPRAADEPDPMIHVLRVFPDYFETMGIPLVSGRRFIAVDGRTKGFRVATVNQSFARRFWPDADASPIGKRIRFRDDAEGVWMTVVGLNRDVKNDGLDRESRPEVCIPYNQEKIPSMYIMIRSTLAPTGLLGPIRSKLREMDPDVPVSDPTTMTDVVDRSVLGRFVLSMSMMLFAAAALLIAAAGVYGVVSYTVSRRTHEIGIRMALGATRGQVLSMVVGESMRLVVAGVVLGVAGAIAVSQAMRSMLFGITSLDAPTYLGVTALLIGVAAAAILLPARLSTNVEPMRALRSE